MGREQDFIYKKNSEKVSLLAFDFRKKLTNIKKWQIVQDVPGKIVIKIVKGKGYSLEDEEKVKLNFKANHDIEATVEYVSSIPLTVRGKSLLLKQNIR